jgi:hypothetical protein
MSAKTRPPSPQQKESEPATMSTVSRVTPDGTVKYSSLPIAVKVCDAGAAWLDDGSQETRVVAVRKTTARTKPPGRRSFAVSIELRSTPNAIQQNLRNCLGETVNTPKHPFGN